MLKPSPPPVLLYILAITSLLACCAEGDRSGVDEKEFIPNYVDGSLIQLSGGFRDFPNGAWCWFQDPRAIIDSDAPGGPTLLVSSFSAKDRAEYAFRPWDPNYEGGWAKGDNDLFWFNLSTAESGQVKLHRGLTQDDHNVGALTKLPDGRYLTAYADHGYERETYFRKSVQPHDPTEWGPPTTFTHGDTVTYSNLYTVSGDEMATTSGTRDIINLVRAVGYDPNVVVSQDNGQSWTYRGRLLGGEGRPYVRYAQGRDRIHFIATDQHPRDFDNSVFHGTTDGVSVYDSYGTMVDDDIADNRPAEPYNLTPIHEGAPSSVGWTIDIEADDTDNPYAVFSVQKNAEDRGVLPGLDHRYHYARFNGKIWSTSEIAYAGSALFEREQDYTGLAALDPNDPNYIVISTNADPVTGEPLISRTDGKRHWELFEGRTSDGGRNWQWNALTRDSAVDNIRPIIPTWKSDQRVVLWMRGQYHSYHDWNTQIVGMIQSGKTK